MGLFNENGKCSKRSSSKAAGLWARGAYTEYVSTPKARERSWLVCRSLGEGWPAFFNISRKGSEDLAKPSTSAVDSSNLGQAPRVKDDCYRLTALNHEFTENLHLVVSGRGAHGHRNYSSPRRHSRHHAGGRTSVGSETHGITYPHFWRWALGGMHSPYLRSHSQT